MASDARRKRKMHERSYKQMAEKGKKEHIEKLIKGINLYEMRDLTGVIIDAIKKKYPARPADFDESRVQAALFVTACLRVATTISGFALLTFDDLWVLLESAYSLGMQEEVLNKYIKIMAERDVEDESKE